MIFAYLSLIQNAMHGGSTSTPLTTRNDSIAIDTLDELLLFWCYKWLVNDAIAFSFSSFCLPLISISVDEVKETKYTFLHADSAR